MKTFLHTGDLGDIISSLPAVRKAGGGVFYLQNRPDVTKPLTQERFESIAALMRAQPYIHAVEWYDGQPVDHDFTHFRQSYQPNTTLLEIHWRWIHRFGAPDLKSAWLTAGKFETHGRPVIARSPRYHNPEWNQIWPEILMEFPDPIFIGSPVEHFDFEGKFGPVEYRSTKDLLEVAQLIAGSSVFIGNQSCPYWIAEGLKHPAILEAFRNERRPGFGQDCRFPDRPGLRYVESFRQWRKLHKPSTLMIALQVWDGDAEQAKRLMELICDLEDVCRKDIELAIVGRKDIDQRHLEHLYMIAERRFSKIHIMRGRRSGTGWPNGCNDLWQDMMRQLAGMKKHGETLADGVLTFEADCLPMRKDWLNVLKREWQKSRTAGLVCVGHAHNEPATHINGNAIFAIDAVTRFPELQLSRTGAGWDVEHGKLLLKHGRDSDEIFQLYRVHEFTQEILDRIVKNGKRPAFYHGCKDPGGIDAVRELLGV